jgi:alkaline phosphatase
MTKEERSHPLYTQLAALPMKDAAHGGEDVPVFATGKGSGLIQGVFEQNYIPYVISFSTCIGPAAHLNIQCSKQMGLTGSSSILNLNLTLLLISLIFLILR